MFKIYRKFLRRHFYLPVALCFGVSSYYAHCQIFLICALKYLSASYFGLSPIRLLVTTCISARIRTIDAVVITHSHADAIGGL